MLAFVSQSVTDQNQTFLSFPFLQYSSTQSNKTMDSFYSYSSYFSSSTDQTTPRNPTNPILIPISSTSDQNSTPVPVHLPASYLSPAAVKIQSVYRGHLVRCLIRTIRSVDAERARLERLIQRQETVDAVRDVNSRERIRINEMLMKALLRLDSVPGFYPEVRQLRRDVSRRIVTLQEVLDAIVAAEVKESEVAAIPASLQDIVDRICRGEMDCREKRCEECWGRCVWQSMS